MNTTADHTDSTTNENKSFWVQRTLAPVGIAAGLALALALSACGTDQAVQRTSADPGTTASSIAQEHKASAQANDAPSESGTPASSTGGGQSSGNGSTDNAGNELPKPVISSFNTPENIDCHNGNFQEFTASWTTQDATKVTISIDGPGVYNQYPANGETSLPFNCSSSHTFLLTAYGAHGATATKSITLDPRNVQTEDPAEEGDELLDVRTTAKTKGQSAGTGPLDDASCAQMAAELDAMYDDAADKVKDGDFDGAESVALDAELTEENGKDLGCTFSFGPA